MKTVIQPFLFFRYYLFTHHMCFTAALDDAPLGEGETFELVGIRTDCIKLPFSVSVKHVTRGEGGAREIWQECLSNGLGPYVSLPTPLQGVSGVRVVWPSTDMHMMDGLCSARAGGGLHLQLVAACLKK